jgi:hypothetical protein
MQIYNKVAANFPVQLPATGAARGREAGIVEFLKTIVGKVVTGAIVLAVVACGISWYSADPQTRGDLLSGTGRVCSWLGIVLVVPWVSFAVIGWVAKMERNVAGAILVGAYALIEALVLAWLFHWNIRGGAEWAFFILGVLFAAAYNLFTCDWIAEKVA